MIVDVQKRHVLIYYANKEEMYFLENLVHDNIVQYNALVLFFMGIIEHPYQMDHPIDSDLH